MDLQMHPTVQAHRPVSPDPLTAEEFRLLCLEAGADDVGLVAIDRPELDSDRADILRMFPAARTVACLICRMNPEPVRSPARNVSNLEFHTTGHEVNEVARRVVQRLGERKIRALNPPMAFPMEMDRFPAKAWAVSLKPLAVAAGLGRIGIHRNLIHPRFGNFVLLGAVLVAQDFSEQSEPIDYNPCLSCKLCVAACPVGAISPQGAFDFSACYTHNYREFMGGFTDWVETVADSSDALDYRSRVSDSESASMWQSLAYGANYKAAYCLAVCPAGSEVIGPYLEDGPQFLREVLKPLQAKVEPIYVASGSDAESYVQKRYPHKEVRRVRSGLRPTSLAGFLQSLHLVFQRGKAAGWKARYHFVFTGQESAESTIVIEDGKLRVEAGLQGNCQLRVTADSHAWVKFVRKDWSLLRLLLTGKLRLKGNPRWLQAFGRCFP